MYLTSAQSPLPLRLRPAIGPRETPAGASRRDLCQVGVFSSKAAARPRAGCAAAVPITLRRRVEMVLSGHLPFRIRSWGWPLTCRLSCREGSRPVVLLPPDIGPDVTFPLGASRLLGQELEPVFCLPGTVQPRLSCFCPQRDRLTCPTLPASAGYQPFGGLWAVV